MAPLSLAQPASAAPALCWPQVPTFKPSDRSKQINMFAQSIGDDRAAGVRRKYGKPLKAVIITSAGELPLDAPQEPPLTALVSRETASAAVA
ncbi:peptidyl-prolyl cis-trans isomerase [Haematococcus lacustris]|uniref:Peptidyl-prolyl cis-trans isomerase n=1 Tax=Haematococcus lacustris TaxID=44745 RepID=A0A699Z850_HAELA|nr:peptidyl-prolyl cis-trans isomerase [Haematococcus lacustris]